MCAYVYSSVCVAYGHVTMQDSTEDVDAVIREVNELLGETPTREATTNSMATAHKTLLSVDRRCVVYTRSVQCNEEMSTDS